MLTDGKKITSAAIVVALILLIGGAWFLSGNPASKNLYRDAALDASTTPNIVLINIDSLRADHMGVYGYNKNTTPFLDSLFRRGVIFENAYAPAYLTFQTDGAILSSLYPSENNMQIWNSPIKEGLPLLPGILRTYGYHTAAFVSPSLWDYFGLGKQFDSYRVAKTKRNIAETKNDVAEWIQNTHEPFFLFWHIYDVHKDYMPASEEFASKAYSGPFNDIDPLIKQRQWIWAGESTSSVPLTTYFNDGTATTSRHTLTADDVDYLISSYDTGIRYVDEELRLFFDSIKDNPVYENTIFVISSEHGDDLEEHEFTFHRDLYNVTTHIPLAIIYPKSLRYGHIAEPVSSIDILPTLLTFAHIPLPVEREGADLGKVMRGETMERTIYTERPPFDEYAVVKSSWKYILRNPVKTQLFPKGSENSIFFDEIRSHDITNGDELYNLASDPNEQTNLLGSGLPIEKVLHDEAVAFKQKMTTARNNNVGQKVAPEKTLIPYP